MSVEIRLVQLKEKKFVGIPCTSAFANHEPERIEAVRLQFMKSRGEIRHVVDPEQFACISFTSEVLFTYSHCLEVDDIDEVPGGMIGFSDPAHDYVVVRAKGDPYEAAYAYLSEIGKIPDKNALFWEEYRFANPIWPDEAWVYVPIKEESADV
ncbi:GyrI-like domain-containing protein [Paenibacillus sp. R14(2021)]|uniref:GyrI-like domain-containing protein n=1 Tax=Paenibacillus sp. R14(2021) TaxID=2859228 RepID=UPI001C615BD7|nr:GyrI-like domain-containing protein [Paenibacillus sp. R14(2021)]